MTRLEKAVWNSPVREGDEHLLEGKADEHSHISGFLIPMKKIPYRRCFTGRLEFDLRYLALPGTQTDSELGQTVLLDSKTQSEHGIQCHRSPAMSLHH
jgi:hypothetical protein